MLYDLIHTVTTNIEVDIVSVELRTVWHTPGNREIINNMFRCIFEATYVIFMGILDFLDFLAAYITGSMA